MIDNLADAMIKLAKSIPEERKAKMFNYDELISIHRSKMEELKSSIKVTVKRLQSEGKDISDFRTVAIMRVQYLEVELTELLMSIRSSNPRYFELCNMTFEGLCELKKFANSYNPEEEKEDVR